MITVTYTAITIALLLTLVLGADAKAISARACERRYMP